MSTSRANQATKEPTLRAQPPTEGVPLSAKAPDDEARLHLPDELRDSPAQADPGPTWRQPGEDQLRPALLPGTPRRDLHPEDPDRGRVETPLDYLWLSTASKWVYLRPSLAEEGCKGLFIKPPVQYLCDLDYRAKVAVTKLLSSLQALDPEAIWVELNTKYPPTLEESIKATLAKVQQLVTEYYEKTGTQSREEPA